MTNCVLFNFLYHQIGALRGVLAELQAKKKERQWSRHQTSGELDDGKIIEGQILYYDNQLT